MVSLDGSSLLPVVCHSPVGNFGFAYKVTGQGSMREGRSVRGLLRPKLELAHCYFCHILLAEACPKTSLSRFKGGELDLVETCHITLYKRRGSREDG